MVKRNGKYKEARTERKVVLFTLTWPVFDVYELIGYRCVCVYYIRTAAVSDGFSEAERALLAWSRRIVAASSNSMWPRASIRVSSGCCGWMPFAVATV